MNPPTPEQPVYMIGLGTGIAPLRAAIQEREAQRADGINVGPMSLLFGSRRKKDDYLYEEEIMEWAENGLITNVFEAFSRD